MTDAVTPAGTPAVTPAVSSGAPTGLAALVRRTSPSGGPAAARVVLAARVTAGILGAGALGVGVHAVRTGTRLLRH